MSVQVENLEKNTAKLTIEVPAEKFEEAVQHSYNKNKGKFNIPGFRKGKAPFNMIKKMYGVGVFYEDAVDEVIDAMRRIGNEMSPNIKETGQGGLATTPTAIQIGKSL